MQRAVRLIAWELMAELVSPQTSEAFSDLGLFVPACRPPSERPSPLEGPAGDSQFAALAADVIPVVTPLHFADVDDAMDRAIARIVGGSAPASEILDEVHVQIEAALNRP